MNYIREWQGEEPCVRRTGTDPVTETGAVWGSKGCGLVGWGRWTKKTFCVMNASLTWLSWSQCDRSIAICHIIVHSHGFECHSNSAPMTYEKHWIRQRHSVSLPFVVKSGDPGHQWFFLIVIRFVHTDRRWREILHWVGPNKTRQIQLEVQIINFCNNYCITV